MKRKILISLIISIAILAISTISFAAVEIVPSKNGAGTDAIVNVTVSDSYLLCRGMKNIGESLYGCGANVEPHLATNKDWGAVSYLSNSIYGTNTTGGNTGKTVSINGVSYYSTTPNITGVMNWGSNPNSTRITHTAGLCSDYQTNNYITELVSNSSTKFVELINISTFNATTNAGMALSENISAGTPKNNGSRQAHSVTLRLGMFGYNIRNNSGSLSIATYGGETSSCTFRPVIWNNVVQSN